MKEEELGKLEKKVSLAAALILTAGHRTPGIRGWELRRRIGKNYPKILEALEERLKQIGLRLKVVHEGEKDDLDRARFYVVVNDPLSVSDLTTIGFRLDELAILAATLAFLFTRNEKAPLKEVVEMLESKYPKWRVESAIEKLIRRGYLIKTEEEVLTIGWRTKVEVEKQALLKAFAEITAQKEGSSDTAQASSSSQPL